ncbi:MAG: serine/threonine protein kinase [Myxococcales bacterium]|nr:serine/threonine protein kinase [Myxococcales bacterium]
MNAARAMRTAPLVEASVAGASPTDPVANVDPAEPAAVADELDNEPDLVGTDVKGFRVTRHIAEGGMGHVYEATTENGDRVALKVLHTALMAKPEVAFRFRREAELLDVVKSEHVPRLLARGRDKSGRPFMVLELIEGDELGQLISENGRIPLLPALDIAIQMCRALVAAHAAGVVHRDLKPGNVIVGGDLSSPIVKVLDFSVSKSEDLKLTAAGTIIGTPSYMPPEQARGDEIGPGVDIYAVGAILYDMLCGRPPYEGTEPGQVLAMLLTKPPPNPRSLAPLMPESVEQLILKAIARSPKQRFPIVEALLEALESQHREMSARGSSETLAPPEPSNPGAPPPPPSWLASGADVALAASTRTPVQASSRSTRGWWLVVAFLVIATFVAIAVLR